MAFNPQSTISLITVDFDGTYKNVAKFSSRDEQRVCFNENYVAKTFTDYLTVRRTTPDGQLVNGVKVNANIESLYQYNYMYYSNGGKRFYAFIKQLVYVNEGTTEIIFKTDVFQTWQFDFDILASYVVREHSETDNIGGNIVPEQFNCQDYEYRRASVYDEDGNPYDPLAEWGYLVSATERWGEDNVRGLPLSGIYQGLYFYYFTDVTLLNTFLTAIEDEGGDCIQSISVIPKFCVSKNNIRLTGANDVEAVQGQGFIHKSDEPAETTVCIGYQPENYTFEGYTPKNKKLYTSPYHKLLVTNNAGEQAEYEGEFFDFDDPTEMTLIKFKMHGDISGNPSVTLIPYFYRGASDKYDSGISISGFPQCAFNTDTYRLWLAKNQYGIALDTIGNIGQIAMGVVGAVATGGVGGVLGATQAVSGVQGLMNTMNNVYMASKQPNQSHSGSAKNNLLTAIGKNKFEFYWQRIKRPHAEMIDSFFTMYGYQTNKVKIPNLHTRQRFNYVQTVDINIKPKSGSGIPCDDMEILRNIFNNGVTLWHDVNDIGNYVDDNLPI